MKAPFTLIAHWSWIAILLVWFPGFFLRKKTLRVPNAPMQILNSMLIVAGFFFAFSPRLLGLSTLIVPQSALFGWLGAALNLAGIAFAIWARLTLGRNWSGGVAVAKEGHELIQTGPYAIVRHPIYTGLLLGLLGTVLTRGTVASFIGFAAVAIGFTVRVLIEDRLMSREFGAVHEAYRQRTYKLIPFVW